MKQKSLNDINDSDLAEIKKLAALFFTPKEISTMLEINTAAFIEACDTTGDKCFNAFHGGRLQSEVDLRTSTIKLARAGSSPAATMAMALYNQSKIKMLDKHEG